MYFRCSWSWTRRQQRLTLQGTQPHRAVCFNVRQTHTQNELWPVDGPKIEYKPGMFSWALILILAGTVAFQVSTFNLGLYETTIKLSRIDNTVSRSAGIRWSNSLLVTSIHTKHLHSLTISTPASVSMTKESKSQELHINKQVFSSHIYGLHTCLKILKLP